MPRAATGSAHHHPKRGVEREPGEGHDREVPAGVGLLGVGDEGAAPERLAGASFRAGEPEHHRDGHGRQDDADRTRVGCLLPGERADGLEAT